MYKCGNLFRTSPISIGGPQSSAQSNNLSARQRKESSSSVSVGSWQMISGTGSLRSQESHVIVIHEQQQQQSSSNNLNNNYPHNYGTNFHGPNNGAAAAGSSTSSNAANHGSTETSTLIDDDCFTANDYFLRRERLTAVRTMFYNCYSSTIGYKNGSDSATLGSLLGNFAEKVGLKTPV